MATYIWSILLFSVVSTYAISNINGDLLSREEAFDLLNLEEIDSTTFQNLQDIFREPISVPDNGLGILQQLFPNSFGNIPSKDDLNKYKPWTLSKIREFFVDYPSLLAIKEYLDFTVVTKAVKGSALISASKPEFRKTIVNRMRFSSSYRDYISITGAVDISGSTLLWQSRLLSLHSNKFNSRINFGNFRNSENFIFGYFPSNYPIYTSNNEVVKGSWLYGKRNSWNGLSISQMLFKNRVKTELYGHKRFSETIIGGKLVILPNPIFSLSLGCMSLTLNDENLFGSMNYITTKISLNKNKNTGSFKMAYETKNRKFAFLGKFSRKNIGRYWNLEIANIAESSFVRSSIYHSGEYLINRNSRAYNSISKADIWYLKADNFNKFSRSFKLNENVIMFNSNSIYIRGDMRVSGDILAPFGIRNERHNRSYSFGVSIEPTRDKEVYRYRQSVMLSLINIHNSIIAFSSKYSHIKLRDYSRKYFTTTISDKIIVSKYVEVTPLIFYKNRVFNNEISWESGCGFAAKLRDKSVGAGEVSLRLPIIGDGYYTVLDSSSEVPFMGVAIYANIVLYI